MRIPSFSSFSSHDGLHCMLHACSVLSSSLLFLLFPLSASSPDKRRCASVDTDRDSLFLLAYNTDGNSKPHSFSSNVPPAPCIFFFSTMTPSLSSTHGCISFRCAVLFQLDRHGDCGWVASGNTMLVFNGQDHAANTHPRLDDGDPPVQQKLQPRVSLHVL